MKKNTLSGQEYLWDYLFWGVVGYIWYHNLLFTNIEELTVFQSNLVLIGSMVIGFIINTVLSVQWSRNTFSIITSLLILFGIYTFITYNPYLSNLYKPLLIVAGIILVSGIAVAVFTKVNLTNRRRIRMIRKRRSVIVARTVGAITSAVIIGCILGKSYIGGALISSQECTTSTYGDEYTIANNIDTVLLLKPENWDKVSSAQERLDILQCVVNIEGNYLGLNKEVHIYSKMLDEGVLGYYSARESAVYISAKHLMRDSIYDILDTVGHEMYHAAEHRYVEIYNNLSPEDQASYFFYDACAINNPMWGKYEKEKFCELLLDKRVVAVKSGIDLSKKKLQEKQIERQYDFLKMFMEMAKKYNKPLVLHIREASQEAIDFFKKNPLPVRAEIHCFTYDKDVMMQLIDVGIRFFGIGGMVTRSENFDLQEAVKEMPLDMILIESDAPFVKVEGDIGRVNTSSRAIPTVVRKIAEIKGLSEEEVAKKTYWNAMRFFWGEEFVEFMKTSLGFSEQNFFHTIESPGERPQLAEREVKYTEVSILNIDEWLL